MPEAGLRVCVIVNKHGSALRPSETFLRAHITALPAVVLPLIGMPGIRRCGDDTGEYLLSRRFAARAWRRLLRASGVESLQAQDTRALVRYFRTQRVDVVLAEYGGTAVTVAPACELAGVPLVAHFHGYDAYSQVRDPAVRAAYGRMFRTAARVVAVSRHMVHQLVAVGAPAERVVHNVYGTVVHDAPAHPAAAPPRFVAVGRLTPKKAPLVTLAAFAAVHRQVPGVTLEIIGDGPLREQCERAIDELGIRGAVTLHGVSSHARVFELLRSGRCFVQHSVTAEDGDAEGTPVAILEAMAMGLPVVATRHGGIPDVVEEGRTGFLVDEHDETGMGAALLPFARDPEHAQRVGEAARAAVAQRYTMEVSLERLVGILESVVAEFRQARNAGAPAVPSISA